MNTLVDFISSVICYSFSNTLLPDSIIYIANLANHVLKVQIVDYQDISEHFKQHLSGFDYPIVELDIFTVSKHYQLSIYDDNISVFEVPSDLNQNPLISSLLHNFKKDNNYLIDFDLHDFLSINHINNLFEDFEDIFNEYIANACKYRARSLSNKEFFEYLQSLIHNKSLLEIQLLNYFLRKESFDSENSEPNYELDYMLNEFAFNESFLSEIPRLTSIQYALTNSISIEASYGINSPQLLRSLLLFDILSEYYSVRYSPVFLEFGYSILKSFDLQIRDQQEISIIISLIINYLVEKQPEYVELDLFTRNITFIDLQLDHEFEFQRLSEIFIPMPLPDHFDDIETIYDYFTKKFDIHLPFRRDEDIAFVQMNNWFEIYNYLTFKTRLNPDTIVDDFIFSNYLLNLLEDNKLNQYFDNWIKNVFRTNIKTTIELNALLASLTNKTDILRESINILSEKSIDFLYFNFWTRRLILYIADHFYEIETSTIKEFLQLALPQIVDYLTPDILILQLLNCLVDEKTLSAEELYYLQNYLDLDLADYSKDSIAELIYSINQLERSPKMLIKQEDGTILQFEEQTTSEGNSITMQTPEILTISEEITDLIPAEDLMDYLYFFFEYHNLTRFSQEMSDEKKYNELNNLKAYIFKFEKNMVQFTKLRQTNKWGVDDIQIEFALIDTLKNESPEYATSKLTELQTILENRDVPESDWIRFNQLQSELGIEQTV